MIFGLDERLLFPDPALAEDDGLLAIGGDLSAERLLLAYKSGIFPWFGDNLPIMWYSPHQRFVLYPHLLVISKSMRRVLKSNTFSVTYNQAFTDVITACAAAKREGQDGTWITAGMIEAYNDLHKKGYAHSVEVWMGGKLVGGLYGVEMGSVFCGESMFSSVSNASKTALINLCLQGKYKLIDCQVYTSHLESMGAVMISRQEYMAALTY
ncbi:leucyl/phenylalanyl-tRNA--protein transferase [Mucilaginibacter hurinus]|uniref:Leucyl/phenylalanyl-tRNA--protein transferase n=1 Tax=Mucilaginibacter hurinus TaxID=2201324 RepID=A0A367GTK3_9SPHI|nr:leucyl/phenylalanyl-tRNA--protein transferase [Mucilaginibacter hurinus]RCH56742.1 leucyl/phenylalanyl-tRNA--protein transferase [Mucilaginibacter hurinus]